MVLPKINPDVLSPDTLVTTSQLADRWGLSPDTLENWRVRGQGPAFIRLGRKKGPVRYRLADILAFEEARVQGQKGKRGA